jgi:hypothetical protein
MKAIRISLLAASLGAALCFGADTAAPFSMDAKPAAAENAPARRIGPEARRKIFRRMLTARIARALHLTPAQQAQLRAIRGQTAASVRAIRADQTLTADQKAERIRQAKQGARRQIHGILTAEQEVKLHKIQRHLRKLRSLLAS